MSVIEFTKIFALELPTIEKALAQHFERLPKVVQPAVKHTSNAGGKRLRPLLTVLCAKIFGKVNNEIYNLAATLEMIHLASLLHDDVIDNALTRRNTPTAHTIFGTNATVLAGDALLGYACEYVSRYGCPHIFATYAKALMNTTKGELEEISFQGSLDSTEEEFYDVIRGKTAFLIRASCMMGAYYMQSVTKSPVTNEEIEALGQYGEELGLAFQLFDDALDFAPESQIGKPSGGDIREGKATLPIRAYYNSLPEDKAKIFKEKFSATGTENEFTQAEVEEISQEILQKGYDNIAREAAKKHLDNARNCLDIFPNSSVKNTLIAAIDYLGKRNS